MDIFKDQNMRLNFVGGGVIECASNETKHIDTFINENMFFTGADYFCSGNFIDTVTVQIYFNGTLLFEPVKDIYVGSAANYVFYKANLEPGHLIRVIYKNNGGSASSFKFNLMLHLEV